MRYIIFLVAIFAWVVSLPSFAEEIPADPFDWSQDWVLPSGFVLEPDTEGYHFPTAIAFVPEPGTEPNDPLYFVTELRGTLKVVTNDRTVYVFARDFFHLEVPEELPSSSGESGLAGICLAPQQGYVFVTFAYQNSLGVLRNNIIRFTTKSRIFSTTPTSQVSFTEMFAEYPSAAAHQIGPCQIKDDLLFVSVGDGGQPQKSQNVHSPLGKVLRMTLDGEPVSDNPFWQSARNVSDMARYVWAYGFRNPFSLKLVGNQVFVADNGTDFDRFLEIHNGQNYLWDGRPWSLMSNADFLFVPSQGPVQLDYLSRQSDIFPEEYVGRFFVAVTGEADPTMPKGSKIGGIVSIDYSLTEHRVPKTPEYFLRYRGAAGMQMVTGLAFGPNGLYFVPIYPDKAGVSAIYRIRSMPGFSLPIESNQDVESQARLIMVQKGCPGCHSLNGSPPGVGPTLDRKVLIPRLQQRLHSSAYVQTSRKVDAIDADPFRRFRKARAEVLAVSDIERLRVWVRYKLQEPRFDNPHGQMPTLGLTEKERRILVNFLIGTAE